MSTDQQDTTSEYLKRCARDAYAVDPDWDGPGGDLDEFRNDIEIDGHVEITTGANIIHILGRGGTNEVISAQRSDVMLAEPSREEDIVCCGCQSPVGELSVRYVASEPYCEECQEGDAL